MNVLNKIAKKNADKYCERSITVVCLGDSVTQGCFECYATNEGRLAPVYETKSSYAVRLKELLNVLYPQAQVNVINSGKSGAAALHGVLGIERDVLCFHPDLVIVSYGLNDTNKGEEGIDEYENSLRSIFQRLRASDTEIIFLTQNYMCTKVNPRFSDGVLINVATDLANRQNSGLHKRYIERAKAVCEEFGVTVCDLYSVWEKMEKNGVDVNELLFLNHPIREYHYFIAIKIIETLLNE